MQKRRSDFIGNQKYKQYHWQTIVGEGYVKYVYNNVSKNQKSKSGPTLLCSGGTLNTKGHSIKNNVNE